MQITVAIVLALAAVAGAFPNGHASSDYAPSSYAATSDYAPASHSASHAQPEHTGSKSHEDSSKPESSHGSLSDLDLNVGTLGLGPKPADLNRPVSDSHQESTLRTPSQLKGGSQPTIAVGEPNNSDDGIPLSGGSDSKSGIDAIKLENGGDILEDTSANKSTDGAAKPAKSIVDSTSKEKAEAQLSNGEPKLGNEVPKPADISVPKSTNGAAQTTNSIVDSTSKESNGPHPVNGGSQPGSEAIKPGSEAIKPGSEAIKPAVSGNAPIDVPGSKFTNGAIPPTNPVSDNASKEHVGSQPVNGGLKSTNEAAKPSAGVNAPVNVNGAKSTNGAAQLTNSIVDSTSKVQPVSQPGSGTTGASKSGNEAIKPASGSNVPVNLNGPNTNGAAHSTNSIVDSTSKVESTSQIGSGANAASKPGNEAIKPAPGGNIQANVNGSQFTNGAAQTTNSIVDSTSKGQPVSQTGSGASSFGTKTAVGGDIPIDVSGTKFTDGATQPIKPTVDSYSKENVGSQIGQGGSNSGNGAINPAVGVNVPVNANAPKFTTGTVQPIEIVVDSTPKPNVGSQLGDGASKSAGVDIKPDQTIQVDTNGKDSGKGNSQPGLVNAGVGSTSDEKVRPKTGYPKPSIVHGAYKHRHSDSETNQGGLKPGHMGSPLLGLDIGAGSKVGSKNHGDKSTPVSGSRADSHIGTKLGSDHEGDEPLPTSEMSSDSARNTHSVHYGYTKSDYA